MLLKMVLVSAIIVAFTAVFFRPRFPETASNVGTKTARGLAMKLLQLLEFCGSLVGISPVVTSRALASGLLFAGKSAPDIQETTTEIEGVEVLILRPTGQTDKLRPGIIHIHGGGWVFMSPAHYRPFTQALSRQTGSVVISINYRLAPEYPFPIPFEDCLKATRRILKKPEKYGIDPRKIGIIGDSSGGNLAAAVSLNITNHDGLRTDHFRFLALLYPALQMTDFQIPAYRDNQYGPGFLDKHRMLSFWLWYAFGDLEHYDPFWDNRHFGEIDEKHKRMVSVKLLPDFLRKENTDSKSQLNSKFTDARLPDNYKDILLNPMFAPLMASDEELSMFPPTYIVNAEFDVLRDDGFMFAERLKRVGVRVKHSYLPSEEHGILMFPENDLEAKQAFGDLVENLNEALK
ncbi:arylacetamide deacetylase-like [Mya arenaria]|uniref:arylacetamide deacetylase-like n=1 Tax=Mya arenaria TaxID=6604 RepID=UPI0022E44D8E|nr:arylacetamide deacetylase-like [Mya arenaria]